MQNSRSRCVDLSADVISAWRFDGMSWFIRFK